MTEQISVPSSSQPENLMSLSCLYWSFGVSGPIQGLWDVWVIGQWAAKAEATRLKKSKLAVPIGPQ